MQRKVLISDGFYFTCEAGDNAIHIFWSGSPTEKAKGSTLIKAVRLKIIYRGKNKMGDL